MVHIILKSEYIFQSINTNVINYILLLLLYIIIIIIILDGQSGFAYVFAAYNDSNSYAVYINIYMYKYMMQTTAKKVCVHAYRTSRQIYSSSRDHVPSDRFFGR